MRISGKILWGLIFLLGAAALIVGKLGFLQGVGFWSVIFSIILVGTMIDGVRKRSFGQILFSLAFLGIVNQKLLGIEDLVPWTILTAALLGTIGLNILFPQKGKKSIMNHIIISKKDSSWGKGNTLSESYSEVVNDGGGEAVSCEVVCGEGIKYIYSTRLQNVSAECTFGSLTLYLDGAKLMNGRAHINLEVTMGGIKLYIPKEWKVMLNRDGVLGGVEEYGENTGTEDNTLIVNAEVNLGGIEIYYV